MKWIFSFLIGCACLYAEDERKGVETAHPLFVSLGCDCMPSIHLRGQGLRQAAFPFDWNFTFLLDKFLLILEEDFAAFLSPRHLIEKQVGGILNTRYMIDFKHDGIFLDATTGGISTDVSEKYERRIERFRNLRNYRGKVVFIRSAHDFARFPFYEYGDKNIGKINATEAVALRDALVRYFPHLDFALVIVNYDTASFPAITGIDRVIEFRISSYHKKASYAYILSQMIKRFPE